VLSRLAGKLAKRAKPVVGLAVVGAAIAGYLGAGLAAKLSPYGADDPATQSVQATARFERATGRQLEPGVVALVRSGPVGSTPARHLVEAVGARLASAPDVAAVYTYYSTGDPDLVGKDRRSTYVLAYLRRVSDLQAQDAAVGIERRFAGWRAVDLGGPAVANAQINKQVSHDLGRAELAVFPLLVLLSIFFFRSPLAAALPPLLGGLAILLTFAALALLAKVIALSVFALNLTTGLGLGLAIDYTLLMVSRYREAAATKGFTAAALQEAVARAGRTILFSALTVACATASLTLFPQRFLYSMGIAGTVVVGVAAAVALLVLPALLALLGPRLDAFAPAWLARKAEREARPAKSGGWYRLAQLVMDRPVVIAVLCAAALLAAGFPFLGIRFRPADPAVLPASASSHRVAVALERDFPPGVGTPLFVVAGAAAGSPQLAALRERLAAMPSVAGVGREEPAAQDLAVIEVDPRTPPYSAATRQLVARIRALHPPFYLGVAGQSAAFVDLEHSLAAHLPLALGVVVLTTLLLVLLLTGSVILPLKAVLMNALSLSAVFGILVVVFQDGHLQSLLSFHTLGALDATQPILLFALGFGLTTDYGLFLLSRVREEREAGRTNREAIAVGLERTGRVVTAAAILFAVAVGAFATSQIAFIKALGIGVALAVLIDATVVRALLVPALMRLLGEWNWWAPAPLRRLLPMQRRGG
jgi:uncharacterized membrane protein YdfJ with MMPL/SSD domain